jgi:hypothetical protein
MSGRKAFFHCLGHALSDELEDPPFILMKILLMIPFVLWAVIAQDMRIWLIPLSFEGLFIGISLSSYLKQIKANAGSCLDCRAPAAKILRPGPV